MRQSAAAPGRKPDVLFHVPETGRLKTKGMSVSNSDLNIANQVLGIQHHPVYHNIDLHNLLNRYHCVKSVQIQSFFWSVFSCIWWEYGDLLQSEYRKIRTRKNSVFGHFPRSVCTIKRDNYISKCRRSTGYVHILTYMSIKQLIWGLGPGSLKTRTQPLRGVPWRKLLLNFKNIFYLFIF